MPFVLVIFYEMQYVCVSLKKNVVISFCLVANLRSACQIIPTIAQIKQIMQFSLLHNFGFNTNSICALCYGLGPCCDTKLSRFAFAFSPLSCSPFGLVGHKWEKN